MSERLSERQLQRTQAGLAAMLEANQTALVGHMAALLAPIQTEQAEQRAMLAAMQRQLEQMHERQEQMERTIAQAYAPVAAEDMTE